MSQNIYMIRAISARLNQIHKQNQDARIIITVPPLFSKLLVSLREESSKNDYDDFKMNFDKFGLDILIKDSELVISSQNFINKHTISCTYDTLRILLADNANMIISKAIKTTRI